MYHFFFNVYFNFFRLIGWRGELPESAAFVFAIASILFVANFVFSLITGYNPLIRLIRWIDKHMD